MFGDKRASNLQEKIFDNPSEVCPVCLSEFDDEIGKLSCGHAYCFSCIKDWSDVTNRCPLCKVQFNQIEKTDKFLIFIENIVVENREIKTEEHIEESEEECILFF